MKIFNANGKINFVDKNNVLVGFDDGQNCCEHFGHFITTREPQLEGEFEQGDLHEDFNLEDFSFDTTYHKEASDDCDGGYAVFRLTDTVGKECFLTLFNHHNGYYSHGFAMLQGTHEIFSGSL